MSQYTEAVAARTPKGYDLCASSHWCLTHDMKYDLSHHKEHSATGYDFCDTSTDLGFSHWGCECCGSWLGGDRHSLAYVGKDDNGDIDIIQVSACVDCLMYCANGDEPETWN
jgi:hypothetical protein